MSSIFQDFYSGVGGNLLDDFLSELRYGYRAAADSVAKFSDERMRRQALSRHQKEAGDLAFQRVFSGYKQHGSVWEPRNNRNGSFRYAHGVVGGIRFTISRQAYDGIRTIRWAQFRENHALSNQYSFFRDAIPNHEIPFSLILHGPEKKYGEELGFARLVIPDPNLKAYIEQFEIPIEAIDLVTTPTEQELPDAQPRTKQAEKDNFG